MERQQQANIEGTQSSNAELDKRREGEKKGRPPFYGNKRDLFSLEINTTQKETQSKANKRWFKFIVDNHFMYDIVLYSR